MVDWSHRAEHILVRHEVTVDQATEALADVNRVVLDPDPAGRSGVSVRVIGWSSTRRELLSVILVDEEGTTYGANAWPSNSTDQRRYQTGAEE